MTSPRDHLRSARLYLVCDARPVDFLSGALRGGVDIVQLRMKDAPDEEILCAAERFARTCAQHGALFILNDRPDLVVEAGADGVHLGQDDTPVARARELLGAGRIIGLSTHSPEQIDVAHEAGADYIGVGPVYETPTKPGRAAVGVELVSYAAAHARIPFFAIGGITEDGATPVIRAGGRGIAVVRAISDADQPELAARRLRAALETHQEATVGSA